MSIASGSFEVTVNPLEADENAGGSEFGRMSIEKRFSGDLVGVGKGQMLTAGDPAEGTAGYVAMERVSGTLGGRSGSFALQHHATMHDGKNELSIVVVPGSGDGELAGLAGELAVDIQDGRHSYRLEYSLPASP